MGVWKLPIIEGWRWLYRPPLFHVGAIGIDEKKNKKIKNSVEVVTTRLISPSKGGGGVSLELHIYTLALLHAISRHEGRASAISGKIFFCLANVVSDEFSTFAIR